MGNGSLGVKQIPVACSRFIHLEPAPAGKRINPGLSRAIRVQFCRLCGLLRWKTIGHSRRSDAMRRLPTFIFGMVIGGVLIYLALNYHLVRASDGLHLVPKVSATLSDTYVDVRSFRPSDFLNHRGVVEAMMKSGQQELVDSLAADAVKNEVKARLPGDEK
jgi:hypothetical protein